MKIEKSNNPAAVAALVVVLVVIVGRILWMTLGHSRIAAAASRVSAAPPLPGVLPGPAVKLTSSATAVPATEPVRPSAPTLPVTTRNPFSVLTPPVRTATRLEGLPRPFNAARPAATGARAVPFTPLPPLPVRVLQSGFGQGAKQPPVTHGVSALPPYPVAAKGQTEPMLKLTAIVGGTEPLAVVQTANPEPVILHVGDTLDGMRVVVVHDQDIVFARGSGFWTLSLPSAADSVAGSVSITSVPAASPPVVCAAIPEEKTDELQHK